MSAPADRRYLASHEWHKPDGDTFTIGITQQAADELTDITFVSLPKVGMTLKAGDRFGEVESVKATSDLYVGIAGEVTAVNEALNDDPGLINRDPFEAGWMIRLMPTDAKQIETLLTADAYDNQSGH